jgi:hypothetical protein
VEQSPICPHDIHTENFTLFLLHHRMDAHPRTKYRSLSSLLLITARPPFLLSAFSFSLIFYNSLLSFPLFLLDFITPISPSTSTFRSCQHHPFSPLLSSRFSLLHTLRFSLTRNCHSVIRFCSVLRMPYLPPYTFHIRRCRRDFD